MHAIYELKDMLCKELEEYGEKGEMTAGSLDVVDKLAHTIKNLDKIIENYEEEDGYSGNYYEDGRGERFYRQGGNRSYARGRRGNVKRDAMGRYSRERGYSMANEEMVSELRELMMDAPDEKTRMEFQKFITKMEKM